MSSSRLLQAICEHKRNNPVFFLRLHIRNQIQSIFTLDGRRTVGTGEPPLTVTHLTLLLKLRIFLRHHFRSIMFLFDVSLLRHHHSYNNLRVNLINAKQFSLERFAQAFINLNNGKRKIMT